MADTKISALTEATAAAAANEIAINEAGTSKKLPLSKVAALLVSDVAYDASTWDAVTDVAPSKNAVRDVVETLATIDYVNQSVANMHVDEFFTTTASDIGGIYLVMDDTAPGATEKVTTVSTGNDENFVSFATLSGEPNLTQLLTGTYECHLHLKTSTTSAHTAKVYFKLYTRATDTTETLRGTSDTSAFLTTSDAPYELFVNIPTEVILTATDRWVLKLYSNTTGATQDITIGIGGTVNSHFSIDVPGTSINHLLTNNVSAASRLLGRGSAAGAGTVDEIELGTNLSMSGTTLNAAGGSVLDDADMGDIVVSGTGTVLTIDTGVVTYAKMQDVSDTDKVLGRSTAGAGDVEEIACTAAGRALLDDATAAAQRATLATSYTLSFNAGLSWSPADDAVVYWGGSVTAVTFTSGIRRMYINRSGVIRVADVYTFCSGNAGSGEDWIWYIRLNDTSDTAIATVSAADAHRHWVNTSVGLAVSAGDFVEIKSVCPTFATNPTNIYGSGYLLIE